MPDRLGSQGCRAGLVALEFVRHHLTGDLCRWLALQESGGPPTIGIHQPGQADFGSVLPEDIDWKPFPAFPPSARLAVVVGDPSEPGPYVIRVKLPSGVKLMPHQHPEDRVYTVISGVFYVGLGTQFDEGQLQAYPPGAVIVLPGGTPHFHCAKSGTYVTQVTAIGPLGLDTSTRSTTPDTGEHARQRWR